jgi:hypothetical protein
MTKNYAPSEIAEAIKISAELCGSELSDGAIKAMMLHLKPHGGHAVMAALTLCQREVKGRLALPDILSRLQAKDGRPGAEEAWALVANALADEAETVVWTDEMAQASAAAGELMRLGDKVGARMAFRETYERMVADARQIGQEPRWSVSAGSDKARAALVITEAVAAGRLPKAHALIALPSTADDARHQLLTGQVLSLEDKQKAKQSLQGLRLLIESKAMPLTKDEA